MPPQKLFSFCNADEFSTDEWTIDDSEVMIGYPEVSLFKLKSGDYQIIREGEVKAILTGHNYTLIRRDIAKFLNGLFPNTVSEKEVMPTTLLCSKKYLTSRTYLKVL